MTLNFRKSLFYLSCITFSELQFYLFYRNPPVIEEKNTRLILAGYSSKVTGKKAPG
jgi:hypothetical protein